MKKQQILEFIRNRRKSLKINQDEMGEKLDIAQAQYSRYESNKSEIPLDKFVQIMSILGLDMTFFIKETNENLTDGNKEEIIENLLNCVDKIKSL